MDSAQARPEVAVHRLIDSRHAVPDKRKRSAMGPNMRERLGWRNARAEGSSLLIDRAGMTSAAVWFASTGALLILAVIALPHPVGVDEVGLAVVAFGLAAMALAALAGRERLPRWLFYVGCLLGSAAASAAIYLWDGESHYGALAYLWPALYAFCFFSLRAALLQVGALGAMFAAVLLIGDPDSATVAAWVATMGTLLSGGVAVSLVRDRLLGLISHLSDAARSDSLTRLLNRRGFEEVFDVEIERARRTEQSLSVIVVDIDRFKEINDGFGHAAGDGALRAVGASMLDSKRSWDSAARIGGEEFAILAPDTDEHGAYILAERMRTALQASFEQAGPAPLTASFGIATYPLHGQTAGALLQAGDQALYAAKRLGRNRTVISSAEVPGILAGTPRVREEAQVELATLLNLAEALDMRDSGTTTHCQRVARYAELIARELGLPPDAVERVRIAGILHDVGRVGVPDELFSKEGPLTEEEWQWVHSHPETGARMLETTEFGEIGEWIHFHHERPDGTGYPAHRAAGEVPLEAAILGVADAYEAMTAKRPYRAALDPRAATDELRRGAGRQFDEGVVEALLRVV